MKTFNRIISLLMIALMTVTSVPLTTFTAAAEAEEVKTYTMVKDAFVADSFKAENSAEAYFSFFSRTEYDGCYGNQLSGLAKEFYDAIVKYYVTEKRTGEYSHPFGDALTFRAEISDGNIVINAELAQIFLNLDYIMQVAMDAFLYDHPEIFWLRSFQGSYSYSVYGNTGRVNELTVIPVEIYNGASAKVSEYESAVDAALSEIMRYESRYETLKEVHDYICNNAWYNLVSENRVHSSEPFFIGDGGVVCEGYAKSFKVICDRLGIPCALVSGDAGGAHMWNYVQMDDGNWYLVDTTWDDQDSQIYYTYFVANANTVGFKDVSVSEERVEHRDFSGSYYINFVYPVLSTTEYYIHKHEWEKDFTVDLEPTCTEKGSRSIHCKYCEATSHVSELPATNHPDKTEYAQQEPTCTNVGYTAGVLCNSCGEWLEGHKAISALSHDMGTWSENSGGKHIKHCQREGCDYTEGESCTYGQWITTKEPTCKENGVKSKFCSVCNHEISITENALNHTPAEPVEESRTEPDCENDGSYYEVIYCSGCGIVLSKISKKIPALTHDWDSGVINPAPTCKAHGTKTYTCKNDASHQYTEQVALDGNNHVGGIYLKGEKYADCINDGYTGDVYCSDCNVNISSGKTVPAYGHNETSHEGQLPTCEVIGWDAYITCSVCGYSSYEEKAPLGHNYTSYTVPATLAADGERGNKCSLCGKTENSQEIVKIGSVNLSTENYIYDGKNKTPTVTVKDANGKKLTKNVDYKLSVASNRSGIGRYTVKVTFIGNYSGTKNVYFYIKPGKTSSVKSASQTTSSVKLSWSAVPGAAGYTVYRYSPSKKAYVKAGTTEGTSLTVSKLYAGTKYTFKVVAYGKIGRAHV